MEMETCREDVISAAEIESAIINEVEKLLDKAIEEECFWQFLDDTHNPHDVSLCTQYGIMTMDWRLPALLATPDQDQGKTQSRIGVGQVDKFGQVAVKWQDVDDWSTITPQQIMSKVKTQLASSGRRHFLSYSLEEAWNHQLTLLSKIEQGPPDLLMETAAMMETVPKKKARGAGEDGAQWVFLLCSKDRNQFVTATGGSSFMLHDGTVHLIPYGNDIDCAAFKQLAREKEKESAWPVFLRGWEAHFHYFCLGIFQLREQEWRYLMDQKVEDDDDKLFYRGREDHGNLLWLNH
ncbi:hypothetical protein B0H66DRAFT_619556 [Apodospora peruviana]|uniref:Uncharacterized protein n=1 Tax=Apodospora peruviana TaxID=516989 RepID=A0AAE0IBY4_9PEZI|nr:hypothetical protein B0H66DRAFT_619556 [Apodospora peruviana]